MGHESNLERCSSCGTEVDADDGWRALEPAGSRRAVFCRLEHVVPWAMQGSHWDPGEPEETPGPDEVSLRCSLCDAALGETRVVLVRHRGEYRVDDAFCSVEHMSDWAKAGGRWA